MRCDAKGHPIHTGDLVKIVKGTGDLENLLAVVTGPLNTTGVRLLVFDSSCGGFCAEGPGDFVEYVETPDIAWYLTHSSKVVREMGLEKQKASCVYT